MGNWSKEKFQRYLKEGRGQGQGKDYLPWVKVNEYPSKGRASRILGIKTGRIHHLHSDNQLRAFLLFEHNDEVVDIRESYPLLDVMEVIDQKDDLSFEKFRDKESGEQLILTTSFLFTVLDTDGKERHIARSVKDSSELCRKITFEKLEIENRYWRAKGVEWKIITDKQLPRQLAKNIEWVRETLLETSAIQDDKEKLSSLLLEHLLSLPESCLKDVLRSFDKTEQLSSGTGLYLFRYLIVKKKISLDLTKKINTSLRISELLF